MCHFYKRCASFPFVVRVEEPKEEKKEKEKTRSEIPVNIEMSLNGDR